MTDFWIGSKEYPEWWDGEPAHVVRAIETDGATGLELDLVELERTGERKLLGRHVPVAVAPGRPVGVVVYTPPEGWNGHDPVAEADLRFETEPELYARPEELPVVSAERRERRRRGWAF
jgi:hypothetical protein